MKRYSVDSKYHGVEEDENGGLVKYEDAVKLVKKLEGAMSSLDNWVRVADRIQPGNAIHHSRNISHGLKALKTNIEYCLEDLN
jgi:hypothetical protein